MQFYYLRTAAFLIIYITLHDACLGFTRPSKTGPKMSMNESQEEKKERQSISILGSGRMETLPLSYASYPVWMMEPEGGLARIPDAPEEEGGAAWVDPFSFSDLWIPMDSPQPMLRPTLMVLLKDGNPRYVLPGLDTFLEQGGRRWRNRGMRTFPMAHVWQLFLAVPPEFLKISVYTNQKIPDTINDSWEKFADCEELGAAGALDAVLALVGEGPPEIKNGFHFVAAPLPVPAAPIPQNCQRIRVFLNDIEDPIRLLELEDGAETGGGVLDVEVTEIAPAGESQYIPDVYRQLFPASKK